MIRHISRRFGNTHALNALIGTTALHSATAQPEACTDKKILIISYLFPPLGGIGVQRALSLAKYLPRHGYRVHVLKAANAAGPVHDPGLVHHIPEAVTVHQAFTPEIPFTLRQKLWAKLSKANGTEAAARPPRGAAVKRLLTEGIKRVLSPEPEILWVPFALRKARRIVERHSIDYVLVTVPPFSALSIGTSLKREYPHLKLISDFRDEWLSFYLKDFQFQSGDYTRRKAEAIERESVAASDLVVAVNQSSRHEIRGRYPEQPEEKFVVLPNGYDPDVFSAYMPREHSAAGVVVTHAGTVYKTASPRFYLDAADGLAPEMRNSLETRFVGRIAESERALLADRQSKVRLLGFVPQAEALKLMEETDFLLLTMTNEISVPGKLFEYMAAGKPVLAITPRGSEVDGIVRETGAGLCAPPDDPGAIRAMLTRAIEAKRSGRRLVSENRELVRRFERPRLVEEYGRLMRAIG